jgi:2'-5' RNA ligase
MIWASFDENAAFTALATELHQRLEPWLNDRADHEPLPHATLARFKFLPASMRTALPPCPQLTMRVERIVLYESLLSSEGATYKVVEGFELAS